MEAIVRERELVEGEDVASYSTEPSVTYTPEGMEITWSDTVNYYMVLLSSEDLIALMQNHLSYLLNLAEEGVDVGIKSNL